MIPPELEAEIDERCDRFEALWKRGEVPDLEEVLAQASDEMRPHLLWELVAIERHYRRDESGESVSVNRLATIYPQLSEELAERVPTFVLPANSESESDRESDVQLADEPGSEQGSHRSRGLHVRCPHCSNPMEIVADSPYEEVTCHSCGSNFSFADRQESSAAAPTLRQVGRFELISRLGVGGFGTVWKARDPELDRMVAIKIPRKGHMTSADVEQFFREARAAAQLQHPNIVSVHEVGRTDDTVFIVSDLVRGVALSDYYLGREPTYQEIAKLGIQIADALQHAHEQGIIHRDIKPSNVMIDQRGTPLVMDFGLAKREVGEITMTVDGQILGSPGYMSPEQARGQSHWTDRRSDIYSLGTMLFRLTTGELPFRGNARMQLHHKLTEDPPDPRHLDASIPLDLATITSKCIQREPHQRYRTAREVAQELQRFLKREPIKARPISTTTRLMRWARRKPALAAAYVLGVLLAISGPLVALQQRQIAEQRRERLAERDELLRRSKEEANLQAAEIQRLKEEVLALSGGSSGIAQTLPSWRLALIKEFVEARRGEMTSLLDGQPADIATIQAGLGMGMLLAQIGEDERALELLKNTASRISESAESRDSLTEAHADCWMRIGRLQERFGNSDAAQDALEKAVELYRNMVRDEQTGAAERVRQLEATLQQTVAADTASPAQLEAMKEVPEIKVQIERQWPTTAAEFYRLACQLTKSEVLLPPTETASE